MPYCFKYYLCHLAAPTVTIVAVSFDEIVLKKKNKEKNKQNIALPGNWIVVIMSYLRDCFYISIYEYSVLVKGKFKIHNGNTILPL